MVSILKKHEEINMRETPEANMRDTLREARAEIEKLERKVSLIRPLLSVRDWLAVSVVAVVIIPLSIYVVTELLMAPPSMIAVALLSEVLIVVLAVIWKANLTLLRNMEYQKRTYDYLIRLRRRMNRISLMLIHQEKMRVQNREREETL